MFEKDMTGKDKQMHQNRIDHDNYIRLVDACREYNFKEIHDDDLLDINMIYDLALNNYAFNFDSTDDDEMVADWLNGIYKDVQFSIYGNKNYDGNNADEIVKIDNILELKDKFFDLDGNIVE